MAQLAVPLMILNTALSVGGNLSAAEDERRRGEQAKAIAEERAKKSIISGQQKMLYERHKGDLVTSRALALSAAGGGDATDPTSLNIIADIKGESAFREAAAMYTGEEDARILRMGGEIAKEEAEASASAYQIGALSSALSGGATLFDRFGGSQPGVPTATERGY